MLWRTHSKAGKTGFAVGLPAASLLHWNFVGLRFGLCNEVMGGFHKNHFSDGLNFSVLEDNTLGVQHTGMNRYAQPHALAHCAESLKLFQDTVKLLQFVRLDT